ncbi:MAG: PAS domain S-box protein [Bacteroidetes bacterium]|nr:PAS domain S-box protein [Bacteroidota bacterium]MBU1113569.1 PAS domain S-box protein [Bacteroidota bacterium]MBU1798629.1 PAS domain S-box protein [Bacteroidota bacterium]
MKIEQEIKLLALEDLEDDLFIILRNLKRNGLSIVSKRVDTEKEFREALENSKWDIILSDYSLPTYNGLKAFEVFKEYNIDIPFILVSGTMGEEIAVSAMKAGVNDYVMKDNLSRLAPAIIRELVEAKNRNAKKLIQEKADQTEENYRLLVENAADMIVTLSKEGNVINCNQATSKISGWSKEEIIGTYFLNYIHSDSVDLAIDKFNEFLKGISNGEFQVKILKKDGGFLIGSIKTTILKAPNNESIIVGFVRDITQQNELQEKLAILSKASNQSPIVLIITDLDRKVVYFNNMLLERTGYSEEELNGIDLKNLIASELDDDQYQKIWNDVKIYGIWSGEFYNKTKNKQLYWEDVTITPIVDKNNVTFRYLITKINITKRKEIFSELIIAKKEAEAANLLKSEFLAQMSHEIRTPLNTLLSSHQLILSDIDSSKLSEDISRCLKGAENASDRIIRTVDLILNMTDLQTGSYQINKVNTDIYTDVLEVILLEKYNSSSIKGIKINLSKSTNETIVPIDHYSVMQIFDNLIENAIKYTNVGEININCYNNELGCLAVKVTDTGIGIATENLSRIFNAFTQENQGYTRNYEGNGLGLALVKQYCNLNNATIEVESTKGVGSSFTVTFL